MSDRYGLDELQGMEDDLDHGKLVELATKSIKIAELDGQELIQTPDGQFLEHLFMDEDYFVNNWLAQFALGTVGGRSYFDFEGWGNLTAMFTKSIVVVDAEKNPMLVIPKFSTAMIPEEGKAFLERFATEAGNAKNAVEESEKDRIIKEFAVKVKKIGEISDQVMPVGLTAMIPDHYYARFDVNPVVMQQVIYLRDVYKPEDKHLDRAETILKTWNKDKIVTQVDREFMYTLTNGDFIFDDGVNTVEQNVQGEQHVPEQEEFDPFAS